MLSKNEFEVWVRSSHGFYTIFESRGDFYPLSLRLVEEWWRNNGRYCINDEMLRFLRSGLQYLDYTIFGMEEALKSVVANAFNEFLSKYFTVGEHSNVGVAIAPYLFIWNIKRFKTYFEENPQFSLSNYFIALGHEIDRLRDEIAYFRSKRLVDSDVDSDELKVRGLLKTVIKILRKLSKDYVGKEHDEPLATIKILHILVPNYFPLLDNSIAIAVRLKNSAKEPITLDMYVTWMKKLKAWLQNYIDVLEKLEKEFKLPMLKLVDECFYIMCTVDLSKRIQFLGMP
jgi:hypothetical protein